MLIGLTGNAGCGKTTIINYIKEKFPKITTIESDKLIKKWSESEIGSGLLQQLRGNLSQYDFKIKIFKDDRLRAIIEDESLKYILPILDGYKESEDIIIFESAIIIEKRLTHLFNSIILVTCNKKLQINRLKRRNWSKQLIKLVLRKQIKTIFKKITSNFIINTDNYLKACSDIEDILKTITKDIQEDKKC